MMTLTQAAESLGMSSTTLRAQAANGRLKATKLGSQWVVDEREVERYRQEHRGRLGRPRKDG